MRKKGKRIKKKAAKAKRGRAAKRGARSKKAAGYYSRYQEILNRKREDILKVVKQNNADVGGAEIGDEADVASQTFERELMFEMNDGERVILDNIEAALRKIEKGEFGICESCHKKISNERLHAMPWARYCIQCQTRTEDPAA